MNDSRPPKESRYTMLATAWFNLLGWIALIAGVQVLNAKRHSIPLQIVIVISLVLILQHFMALADRFQLPWLAARPFLRHTISSIVGTSVAFGAYFLVQRAVFLFAELSKP